MVEFILFILICILWWYAVDTRRRMLNMAAYLDKTIAEIASDYDNLEVRTTVSESDIELLEKQLAKQSPKKHQVK